MGRIIGSIKMISEGKYYGKLVPRIVRFHFSKMLTGMVAPTNGEICLNGEEGCKPDIGVCPQDNVLIDTLTPREHMIFYSKLKGQKDNMNMEKNVNE